MAVGADVNLLLVRQGTAVSDPLEGGSLGRTISGNKRILRMQKANTRAGRNMSGGVYKLLYKHHTGISRCKWNIEVFFHLRASTRPPCTINTVFKLVESSLVT